MKNQRELNMDDVVKLQAMAEKKLSEAFHAVGGLLLGLMDDETREIQQEEACKHLLTLQRLIGEIGEQAMSDRLNRERRRTWEE